MKRIVNDKSNAAIAAVREWFAGLSPGLATLQEKATEVEHILRLVPVNPRAAEVEFRVSHYGTIDIYFGKAGNVEEVDASSQLLVEVCEAIRRGAMRDSVRSLFGLNSPRQQGWISAGAGKCLIVSYFPSSRDLSRKPAKSLINSSFTSSPSQNGNDPLGCSAHRGCI
jgi:hypothetical protein